ncbi:hypothetical protein P7L53_07265 [Thermoleptolyngbya sichuanensis XZ-Cy5]|uniref:hypothetical protein n=1 Tax=Thermoleptolyngbya sichuanensis TaxID=2885951 RepID=UPI00240D2E71|nr:hypothetical protein [Thermoleptolyngbya sichuanensis]MDG2616043.1 hypothetical protein [Thermoleptolyngbya sichuanensis XZ-Cy5]
MVTKLRFSSLKLPIGGRSPRWIGLLVLAVALLTGVGALAQTANFGSATLAPGFSADAGTLRGQTGGSSSLPGIVANRDKDGNLCLGFGSSTPDHLITLQGNFSALTLQVNSNRAVSTLVVQGPGNVVRCASGNNRAPNATLSGTDWAGGTYRVWVGSNVSGEQFNYTLTIRE